MTKIFFFIAFIFISHFSFGQDNYRIIYRDPNVFRYATPLNLFATNDGTFSFFGFSINRGSSGGSAKIFLGNVSDSCQMLWSNFYFSGNFLGANTSAWTKYQCTYSAFGNYLATGPIYDTARHITGAFLLKVNSNGNIVWSRQYVHFSRNSHGVAAFETFNHQHILFGNIINTSTQPGRKFFLRLDSLGNFLYCKSYVNSLNVGVNWESSGIIDQVIATKDSGYAFTTTEGLVMKVNDSGDIQWVSSNKHKIGWLTRIAETANHNLIAAGMIGSADGIRIIRFNAIGDTLWTKTLSRPLKKLGIIGTPFETTTGNILIPGVYQSDSLTQFYSIGCIHAFDSSGNYLGTKSYNQVDSSYNHFFSNICQLPDNHLLLFGTTDDAHINLLRLDSALSNDCYTSDSIFTTIHTLDSTWAYNFSNDTLSFSSIDAHIQSNDSLRYHASCPSAPEPIDTTVNSPPVQPGIYPNPTSELISIRLDNEFVYSVSLYNAMGQLVYESFPNHLLTPEEPFIIDVDTMPSGIYILAIKTDKETHIKKMVRN